MNKLKYFFSIIIITTLFAGCKKETNDDVSFLSSGTAPSKLSLLFDIAQDNSGQATITPNGENAASYDVFYGDTATIAGTVEPGKSSRHKYGEGTYTVKVVAHSITGQTAQATKQLTVSFKAPENLVATVTSDAVNRLKVNLMAKADYETYFKAYFGETPNEIPMSFNEGDTVSHIYSAAGTYTIRVVALSGGAATTQVTKTVTISDKQIDLPVTFDVSGTDYTMTDFGNNVTVNANDPTNSANKVKKTTKPNGAETWSGTTIGTPLGFATPIPIAATATQMSVRVYSPAAGITIKLKIEDHNDNTKSVETNKISTVANAWETLVFDFANPSSGTPGINLATTYDKASIFFDFGNTGNGKVFYWDDVKFLPPAVVTSIALPLTFESTSLTYTFTDFGGGAVTVISNPQSSGINTSSKVAKMVKSNGQVYGGSFITLDAPINFSIMKTMKVKVFSPRVGAKLLLKVENLTNGGISFEKEVATTTANAWEELTFNYNAISTTDSYQKVVLIFDNGTMGDGSANFTYLFDDITLTN